MADWLEIVWHDTYANPIFAACALLVLLLAYLARGEIKRLLTKRSKKDQLENLERERGITGNPEREKVELLSQYVDVQKKLKDSNITTAEFFRFYTKASAVSKPRPPTVAPAKEAKEDKGHESPPTDMTPAKDPEPPPAEKKLAGQFQQIDYEVARRPLLQATADQLIEAEAQKSVAAAIMLGNGKTSLGDIVALRPRSDPADIQKAIKFLSDGAWIEVVGDTIRFSEGFTDVPNKHNLAALYRHFVTQVVIVKAIGSDWYDSHIDFELLRFACEKIQMGVELNESDIPVALQLMKWSPTALEYALTPDQMIVRHRIDHPNEKRLNAYDRNQFMRSLHKWFIRDFMDPQLAKYFVQTRGLTEINQTLRLQIKNATGVVHDAETSERNAIVQLGEPWGGLFVHVLGIDHGPDDSLPALPPDAPPPS
jgi:hypothetical protein